MAFPNSQQRETAQNAKEEEEEEEKNIIETWSQILRGGFLVSNSGSHTEQS